MRKALLTLLRLAIGAGLLFYLAKSGIIDLRAVPKLLTAWPISLAAIAIFLIDLVWMAGRLCLLLRPQGLRLSYRSSLRLALVGSFFAMFLPGRAGGDFARIFYASKENTARRTEIVAILLFDRALGLFSLLMLPLLLAPWFGELFREAAMRVLLIATALIAAGMVGAFLLCGFVPAWLNRVARGPLRFLKASGIGGRAIAAIGKYARRPAALAAPLGIAFADNLMMIAVIALALLIVNPASVASRLCVVVPMGEIVNSLPLTPGGLGVGEAAFGALFKLAGLHGGAQALLYWRIWNVLANLVGLPFYLYGFRSLIFHPHDASPASDESAGRPPRAIG